MSREELPGFIPIPSVGEYTDLVHVGPLGLPVGFDPETLELNVKGLVRAARLLNINKTIITGYEGETSEYSYGTNSLGRDGSATIASAVISRKEKLGDAHIDPQSKYRIPEEYKWSTATLKINNGEIEDRIKADGDQWDRGLIDPRARSKYMNSAIRSALAQAGKNTVLTRDNAAQCLVFSGLLLGLAACSLHATIDESLCASLFGWLPINAVQHFIEKDVFYGDELPPRMWSNMHGLQLDRLTGGLALTRTTKLIKARG